MADPPPLHGVRTHSIRQLVPTRSPPRNERGEIFCNHKDCQGRTVTFRRPCEFNKHMDRHERPYKCTNPACQQNPGFTYSGGLLRHQREVHKMHLSRRPLYCPHTNCVRSTGTGFTRKENLEEHIRRRHSVSTTDSSGITVMLEGGGDGNDSVSPRLKVLPANRKRRIRQTSVMEDDDGDEISETAMALATTAVPIAPKEQREGTAILPYPGNQQHQQQQHMIKRLKLELARQNQRLVQQEQELEHLRGLLRSLPPSMVYRANTNLGHTV